MRDEERDMWSVYLAMGDYASAARHARTQAGPCALLARCCGIGYTV